MRHVTINEIKRLVRGSGYANLVDEKTVERGNYKTGYHGIEQVDEDLTHELSEFLSFNYPLLVTKSIETRANHAIDTHYVNWLMDEHPNCVFSIHVYVIDNKLNETLRIYKRMNRDDHFRSIPIQYLYEKNPELKTAIHEGEALKERLLDFFLETKAYRLLYVTGQLTL